MANIKLKAILRAYSKTPFYNDFTRDVYSQEGVEPGVQYVRVYHENLDAEGNPISGEYTGEWVALDTALLEKSLKEYQEQVEGLETALETITISVDYINGNLIFTKMVDGKEIITHVPLPEANVDGKTLNKNSVGQLYVVDAPDEKTLKEVDIVYETTDEDGNPIPDEYGVVGNKLSGKLRVTGIYVEDDGTIISGSNLSKRLKTIEKNIKDLEAYTQGMGGHLDPYNFGKLYKYNPTDDGYYDVEEAAERNKILSKYAYTQINEDGSETPVAIPDQTKVKNTYDGIIWLYVESDNIWLNQGTDVVIQANNDGVLGVITGSLEQYKGKIESDGTISINGLKEKLDDMITDDLTSVDPTANSLAKRTEGGQLKTNDPIEDNDSINLKYFNSCRISEEDIDALFGGN